MKLVTRYMNNAIAGALLLGGAPAFAAGIAAGTDVNNTATVDFSVGGVNQPDATSNTVTFEVDRVINLTVAEVGTVDTIVSAGQQNAVTTFTVTNTSNSPQDFLLTSAQDATGATTAHGDTDDFNMNNVEIYLDDGDGVFDAGDTLITFLDEIPADATRTVFVVSDVPAGQPNGQQAGVTLSAQAAEAGTAGTAGAASTQTAGADTAGTVDTVFGDAGGDTDASRDGRHSDDDAYEVATPTISVIKSSRVISDPFNGTTNPKRIPGAVVEYCIEVTNSGGATADAVVVSDDIDEVTTTFNAGSGLINSTSCTAVDGTAGGSYDGNIVTGSLGTVANATTERFQFRVTID
jgi:uncharacterized repeat protein (TIGR01451 family)